MIRYITANFLVSSIYILKRNIVNFQLHQLALCFYEDECKAENLIEYHIFEYTYHENGVTMNVHSKSRNSSKQTLKCTFEDVKERTIHMIRACVVIMQSCQQELPPCYDISLRLYYNEGMYPLRSLR